MERTAATFNSPYKRGKVQVEDRDPQQCVLLRAGGHMSVLDMEQGAVRPPLLLHTGPLHAVEIMDFLQGSPMCFNLAGCYQERLFASCCFGCTALLSEWMPEIGVV